MVNSNINKEFIKNRMESASMLSEAKEEINIDKQDLGTDKKEDSSFVALFFSFDIVNSTKYKSLTVYWANIIELLLKEIRKSTEKYLPSASLWRVIGDEMVFMVKISNKNELISAIDSIFLLTQKISVDLKNGKFFDIISNQKIRGSKDLEIIKIQNTLSLKSAAWITPIKIDSRQGNNTDTVRSIYNMSGDVDNTAGIVEYQGRDMDIGFRLKSETFSKRLIISIEIAYLLKEAIYENLSNENHKKSEDYNSEIRDFFDKIKIMDYKKLKGVWDNNLYPLIFYHDKKRTFDNDGKSKEVKFEDSFEYDESERNPIVKKYYSIIGLNNFNTNEEALLKKEMYDSSYAIDKVADDANIYSKINRIIDIFEREKNNLGESPDIEYHNKAMELDCAVVCCDVENKKILAMKRTSTHKRNPNKYDFGCSDACPYETLNESMKKQYEDQFNVKLELYTGNDRKEKTPIPIFSYELEVYKKGLIFVGKVKNNDKTKIVSDFDGNGKYCKLEWISENEMEKFSDEDLVSDFKHTAREVFNNMEKWFPDGEDND